MESGRTHGHFLEHEVLEELKEEYVEILQGYNSGLSAALRKIYTRTEEQFIFLIDEWDCVMCERQDSETLQKQYLDFLRNRLKDQQHVALAYMTGILPSKEIWPTLCAEHVLGIFYDRPVFI